MRQLGYYSSAGVRGTERPGMRITKLISRKQYYQKIKARCAPDVAERFVSIDAAVLNAKRICPHPIENAARIFLAGAKDTELGDRIRILGEVARGLRERHSGFIEYAFDMNAAIATGLAALPKALEALGDRGSQCHAHVDFKSEAIVNTKTDIKTDFPARLQQALAELCVSGSQYNYMTLPYYRAIKTERVTAFNIVLSPEVPVFKKQY